MSARNNRYNISKSEYGFRRRQFIHLSPELLGIFAFHNSLVKQHWNFMMYTWKPEYSILLVSPCSNVKPYPRSPMNQKIRKVLMKHYLWDISRNKPLIDWVFISDLLGPVPYVMSFIPPACCYEFPPSLLESIHKAKEQLSSVISTWWNRVKGYYALKIIYLPQKYYGFSSKILSKPYNDNVYKVKYGIFYGQRYIDEILSKTLRNKT